MSKATASISFGSSESKETMVLLMERDINFFSHPTPEARFAAIKEIFAPDITWLDFDGAIQYGHDGVFERSSLLVGQLAGYSHRAKGEPAVCQNMVTGRWEVVPEGTEENHDQVPVIEGRDVLVVEDGKIKILWSCVDRYDKGLLPNLGKSSTP
ncbi:hypothetical protein S40288_08425 [Stachybotrys chartarum IBT 40288]|nr:hypothetical protein S40288_08425 [Stachybotrys chartarum IBT 40288]